MGNRIHPDEVEAALDAVRPKLLAMVQGDTSTTMCQPLAELGELCATRGVLFYADVTASLGGNDFALDAWGWTPPPPACRSAWAGRPAARRSACRTPRSR